MTLEIVLLLHAGDRLAAALVPAGLDVYNHVKSL